MNIGFLLRVFVYGTLNRGYWNHEPYCRGALSIEPCVVRGRLYRRHTGTPILSVPKELVLADGTGDLAFDLENTRRLEDTFPANNSAPKEAASERWLDVAGELLTFSDGPKRLARLDELEEYLPAKGDGSLYRRVLISTTAQQPVLAWTYVIPQHRSPSFYDIPQDPQMWRAECELTLEQRRARGIGR